MSPVSSYCMSKHKKEASCLQVPCRSCDHERTASDGLAALPEYTRDGHHALPALPPLSAACRRHNSSQRATRACMRSCSASGSGHSAAVVGCSAPAHVTYLTSDRKLAAGCTAVASSACVPRSEVMLKPGRYALHVARGRGGGDRRWIVVGRCQRGMWHEGISEGCVAAEAARSTGADLQAASPLLS